MNDDKFQELVDFTKEEFEKSISVLEELLSEQLGVDLYTDRYSFITSGKDDTKKLIGDFGSKVNGSSDVGFYLYDDAFDDKEAFFKLMFFADGLGFEKEIGTVTFNTKEKEFTVEFYY